MCLMINKVMTTMSYEFLFHLAQGVKCFSQEDTMGIQFRSV